MLIKPVSFFVLTQSFSFSLLISVFSVNKKKKNIYNFCISNIFVHLKYIYFKGISHPKNMNIVSLFTSPQVVLTLYVFLPFSTNIETFFKIYSFVFNRRNLGFGTT